MSEIKYHGLTLSEVEKSRNEHGLNVITPPKRDSLLKLYLEKFNDPIIRILIIAALLSLVIAITDGHYTETIGIFVAIILATTVGFWFEYDAGKKFELLNAISDEVSVRVLRDGVVMEVPKSDLVVGDIVLLESGEEIPADGFLLSSLMLRVNESTLTGELSTSKTTTESQFSKEATYPSNRVLRGTTVIEGNGVMKVDTIGDNTEFGKVAKASSQKSEETTPLTKQLEKLAAVIGVAGFMIALFTFCVMSSKVMFFSGESFSVVQITLLYSSFAALLSLTMRVWLPIVYDAIHLIFKKIVPRKLPSWWLSGVVAVTVIVVSWGSVYYMGMSPLDVNSWIDADAVSKILNAFMISVTLIVVAVPEGLPMSVTLSLALNMRRMLKSNNLVRKIHASETMGAINVICTDKTGTLTQNQMSVHEVTFKFDALIAEAISVNSTAHLNFEAAKVKTIGNPTESALLLYLNVNNTDYRKIREEVTQVDQIAFSTERKYMATMVDSVPLANKRVVYIKGAPEVIMKVSDLSSKTEIVDKLQEYQNMAMRTLAFAYKVVDSSIEKIGDNVEEGGFTFIGIAAISDPVREDVPQAIAECHSAGIDVKIVTGDTSATAKQIARQIGLWDDKIHNDYHHITGADFEALSDEVLMDRVMSIKIMSRARPSDKQRFVRLLQKCGGVVAVTGDGTNDAPALNFAHVGLSMGSGTTVAKEASDITLIDDSFNSIATAVMWGRSLYKNIQRFLVFQLTINVIAVLVVFIGAFTAVEPPLTITQMLWVNLIMDTFAAAALASLPPSKSVMKNRPRGVNDFIITPAMTRFILGVGFSLVVVLSVMLYVLEQNNSFDPIYDLTIYFTAFVMFQFWNMYNAKSFDTSSDSAFKGILKSKAFILVSLIILVGQIVIVSIGGTMFRVVPLSLETWIYVVSGTGLILLVGEIVRFFKRIKR